MKSFLFVCIALFSSTSLLAQSNASGKMATGLSISLIILLGLVIYMAIKIQKVQRENLALKSKLQEQNKK